MKLPQALSVVKIFNTPLSPFLTLLLTDVLFFTPSLPSPPPIKKRKPGVFRSVESLGQEWGLSLVWNRSRGQAGVDSQSLCKVWGRCPCNPPTPRLVGFPLSLFVLPLGKKKKKIPQKTRKKPQNPPKPPPVLLLLGSPLPLSVPLADVLRGEIGIVKETPLTATLKRERFVQFDFFFISSTPPSPPVCSEGTPGCPGLPSPGSSCSQLLLPGASPLPSPAGGGKSDSEALNEWW